MGKPWTEKLTSSEVVFMNDIIKQMPEAMGARVAFVDIIQKLADAPEPPKFHFVIARAADGDVCGTNDLDQARLYAADEENFVIDAVGCKWLPSEDQSDDTDIIEATHLDEPEYDGSDD